ncbi:hypothetical protein EDD16DRAFT_1810153 [Pisolithus croceorrhizus]|nr:hypothetical protein EDD16DRAFT_1810153 [Pisolithus croceorrhizus]
MVHPQFEARRALWSSKITNAQLNERVDTFGGGISRMFWEDSNVLLLLNDGNEFLIANLALVKYSIAAMTLCSPKLLSCVPETHLPTTIITDMKFIPLLLEVIYDTWEYNHKSQLSGSPNDSYMLTFFEAPSGRMQAVRFMHENMTFGVAAIQTLFPPSMALSSVDIIMSNHSLSTPYGLAIAYSALHENMSFVTIDSTRLYDITRVGVTWSLMDAMQLWNGQLHNLADMLSARHHPIPYPMVFFIGLDHLEDLSSSILRHTGESWLYSFAWKHKLVAFAEGFLSKDSLWGRMVFDHAWEHVLGDMANALKDVIISGDCIVNPDDQRARKSLVHVGGPSVDVEAKLKGMKGMYLEDNENPVGEIVVRGPTVGASIGEETKNIV